MKFQVKFSTKDKKFSCLKHHGKNTSPELKWTPCKQCLSYALVMEDPNAVGDLFVHWYVPYISNKLENIDELVHSNNIPVSKIAKKIIQENKDAKIIQGYNTLDKLGYHGMCPPPGSGTHNYTFIFYALDGKIDFHKLDILHISSSNDFENKLKLMNIGIIEKEISVFQYK